MFLLQILNKTKLINNNGLLQILKSKNYIKNLKRKILLLKKIKKKKPTKVQQNLIMYQINIVLTKKNTIIYVTDVKGNLKLYQSTSSLSITGKQKTTQPTALLKVLKAFLGKSTFLKNKPVSVRIKNVKKRYIVFLLNILENILFIKVIRIYNFLIPHNGCRPKKIKRKKRRKFNFK